MGIILKLKQNTISSQQMEILLLLGSYIQITFLLWGWRKKKKNLKVTANVQYILEIR
jgi:hypothetical protein